ncbi:MAG: pseudouridine synthase [Myxococcota bacterium]
MTSGPEPGADAAGSPIQFVTRADDAVVADKPSGWLVHNSAYAGPRERTLVAEVRAVLGPDWCPVHRLDRQASGCVLLCPRNHVVRWQAAWPEADKRYVALVRGEFNEEVVVDRPIDGRAAVTRVLPLAVSPVERCSLVEARPRTGRLHQIRRHLKHLSHPLLGDANYGKGPLNRDYRARFGLARLALHCVELVVERSGGGRLQARAPVPLDLARPLERLFPGLRTLDLYGRRP